jgi:hypothetical protein
MTHDKPSLADQVEADVQEAVDAMLDASRIIRVRAKMKRELRREFLIQEALLEAQLLNTEGHGDLAHQLNGVADRLRQIQPAVAVKSQGDLS